MIRSTLTPCFIFEGRLDAGTYQLKVTGKEDTDTGRYTVRAIVQGGYTYFVNRCSNITSSSSINDPLYGCQWHLNNDNQYRNSAGQDIRAEEVWPTYTGAGITVAVVDDGMHYQHEDLIDNVLTAFNHNYDPSLTDIYHPFEDHGTAVAGSSRPGTTALACAALRPRPRYTDTIILCKRATPTGQTRCPATQRPRPFPTTAGAPGTTAGRSTPRRFGNWPSRTASPTATAGRACSTPGPVATGTCSTTARTWTSLPASTPSPPSAPSATTTSAATILRWARTSGFAVRPAAAESASPG